MKIILLYGITIICWGWSTVIMRASASKPFIGGLIASTMVTTISTIPFFVYASSEIKGSALRGLVIAAIGGSLSGIGGVSFQILRHETTDFMMVSLIILTGMIAANMVGNQIFLREPITFNKGVAILFAILTAIFANRK